MKTNKGFVTNSSSTGYYSETNYLSVTNCTALELSKLLGVDKKTAKELLNENDILGNYDLLNTYCRTGLVTNDNVEDFLYLLEIDESWEKQPYSIKALRKCETIEDKKNFINDLLYDYSCCYYDERLYDHYDDLSKNDIKIGYNVSRVSPERLLDLLLKNNINKQLSEKYLFEIVSDDGKKFFRMYKGYAYQTTDMCEYS